MSTPYEKRVAPENRKYIERWTQALRVLTKMSKHERERHFDMSHWGQKTECGTVACLAGHCSLDPWFRRRGFASKFATRDEGGGLYFSGQYPSEFFGEKGYLNVFLAFNCSHPEVVKLTREHISYLKKGGNPDSGFEDFS